MATPPHRTTTPPTRPDGRPPGRPHPPDWPLPTETDLPHTGLLCTTVAMLASRDLHLSGGYTSAEDLIPLAGLAPDAGSLAPWAG